MYRTKYFIYCRPLDETEFPLASSWATKEVQKYGKKGGGKRIKKRICAILEECFLVGNVDKSHRMTAQDMWNFLNLKTQEGEIESVDIPKDRKSTRLNSSHGYISYAVFCLKKKINI